MAQLKWEISNEMNYRNDTASAKFGALEFTIYNTRSIQGVLHYGLYAKFWILNHPKPTPNFTQFPAENIEEAIEIADAYIFEHILYEEENN